MIDVGGDVEGGDHAEVIVGGGFKTRPDERC